MLWQLSFKLGDWADSAQPGLRAGQVVWESAMEVRNLDRENPFADDWIRKRFASLQELANELATINEAIGEAGAAVVRVMNAYIDDPNLTNKARFPVRL